MRNRTRLPEKIVNQMKKAIFLEKLIAADKLPSEKEREVSKQLKRPQEKHLDSQEYQAFWLLNWNKMAALL